MERRELCFVRVCGNTKKDVHATNKAVRAHVMRRYKQQQRLASRRRPEEADVEATSLTLTTCLDGELDPFQSLPVHLTRRDLMLLHRNASSAIRTSVHADQFDVYRKRFAVAVGSHPSEHIRYLLQSISAVNESIARSPNAIHDSTVATVACLANIENLCGIASHAAVHIQGLQRMVELRGGPDHLGMRGVLRRLVLWSDLLNSSSSERPVRFPLRLENQMAHLSNFAPSASHAEFLIHTNPDLDDIITLKNEVYVSELLLSLHELSTFLNIIGTHKLPWEVAYPDPSTDVKAKLGVLILHAGLLFIYTNLRETPVGGRIRERLIARLRRALDAADIERMVLFFPAEVLWIVLIGATSAAVEEHQNRFSHLLRLICDNHNIKTSLDLHIFLTGLPALVKNRWSILRCIMENENGFDWS
ncbi:hypothetical protein UA08_01234 [Talaromyces atroroseus]|uniref:Transcription factor domain-containing protein n=1 Tax=Talaromyces atroroseus TaxID=1441469 RepID=A0A1Q5QB56_TALAT|nr:hypothetical protein UA08_01234 [Talaromyces atroroseus]OKL63172.1 hypothetical protein UA08_01234 [Talaromyces atroroseus]